MNVLVTGCAGFIGSSLTDKLLDLGYQVVGIDNFNSYYDPKIKKENLQKPLKSSNFKLYKSDVLDIGALEKIFKKEQPAYIVHLAARAGVRPSIDNPKLYSEVNVLGTVNLLKLAYDYKIKQFIFGSSSSVYGNSRRLPFSEDDPCDQIISPYGASKRSAEFFVESFHKSLGLNCTILRFFTVYGPRGRPDMAQALFTNAIINEKPIIQYGSGSSSRDYTYIDDVTDGILKTLNKNFDFEIINLGNNHPVTLIDLIAILERLIGKKAIINEQMIQAGDVGKTWADITYANKLLNWTPKTSFETGLKKYIKWIKES